MTRYTAMVIQGNEIELFPFICEGKWGCELRFGAERNNRLIATVNPQYVSEKECRDMTNAFIKSVREMPSVAEQALECLK